MTEIKSRGCPLALVETVMQAIMILQGKEPTWAEAKSQLGETAAGQDEGMNKGKKLKREMQGDRAIWASQRGDWECGKKHRENRRTKVLEKK